MLKVVGYDVADRTTSCQVLEAALSPSHGRFSEHVAFNACFQLCSLVVNSGQICQFIWLKNVSHLGYQRLPVSSFTLSTSLHFASRSCVVGTQIGSRPSHLNLSRCFLVMIRWNWSFNQYDLSPAAWPFLLGAPSRLTSSFISGPGCLLVSAVR